MYSVNLNTRTSRERSSSEHGLAAGRLLLREGSVRWNSVFGSEAITSLKDWFLGDISEMEYILYINCVIVSFTRFFIFS